jgi:acyl-CoA carboxylase epsilon subunit
VTDAAEPGDAPLIVSGDPSPEELAALVAMLAARLTPGDVGSRGGRRSEWGAPARRMRGIHRHGPGAWRASAWPR